ncbi:unnamed protein product [Hydatigera taeniaeformis]|uniref:Nuclear pore complex protein Nup98-Nup96 n=1 Tax=Hydatigena taeniaeformis TaxID=6205 RepID=A0A0R3X0U5_HYDTA|nr:unnamed protein product [Hydatigera taeniaeformis]
MFGQTKPVFGTPTTTGFGFGGTQFGTSAPTNQPSASIFGQPSTSTQQTSMFGSSVFGSVTTPIQGTPVKFNAPLVNDTVQKNGQKVQVNAKHICISAMKEYSDKSIEELRVDDYLQNRKCGSAVGTKSIFGPAATTPFSFGAPQTTASSLFGSASTAQSAQSSIFGATCNTGSSLFGSTQPMTSFGQATQNSIFGSKPLFGTPTSTNAPLNLSGAQQSQTGFGFGQNTQSSIFGAHQTFGTPTTTSTSFSLFGSQPVSTQSGGFTFGKPGGAGIFGTATTTTSGLFGPSTPFGAPVASQGGNIFGGMKPAGTSIFGSPATATTASAFGSGFGSGFGSKTTSTGLFGAAPAVSNTGFGLGTVTSSTMQSGLGTGLFGAKKPSPFGAPTNTTAPTFGFGTSGSATAQGTNLFGNTAGFGLGATSQSLQPTGGIFGATNTAPTGSLFSKSAVNSFGLGQPNTSTPSLFGSTSSASAGTVVGNLFGGGSGITPQLGFGGATGSAAPSFGTVVATNQTVLAPLMEQLTQSARAQQHVLDMVRSMPYGQSALFRHLTAEPVSTTTVAPTSVPTHPTSSTAKASGASVLSASAAANTLVELHRANSLSVGRSPGRAGNGLIVRRPMQTMPLNRRQLFTGFREDDALLSAQSPTPGDRKSSSTERPPNQSACTPDSHFFVRRESWKRLNIPRCVRTSIIERSSMAASDFEQQTDETEAETRGIRLQRTLQLSKGSGDANISPTSTSKVHSLDLSAPTPLSSWDKNINGEVEEKQLSFTAPSSPQVSVDVGGGCEQQDTGNWTLPPDVTLNQTTLIAPCEEAYTEESDSHTTSTANKAGIRLSKPGYYMFPTFEELDALIDENGRCVVQDFVIGRQSYGHILFPGLTDITGIDFDDVVHIRRREVVVYPDDTTKPPQGYGLNRKAEITLDGVWPTDKSTREFIKSPERLAAIRFDERLEKATHKMDASFIEYRPDTGSWVFEVKHFSKYRLEDSDDEEEQVSHLSNAAYRRQAAVEVADTLLSDPAVGAVHSLDPLAPAKDLEDRNLSSDEKSVSEMQISSLQTPQTLRGARTSLFFTNGFGDDELDFQMEADDSDFPLMHRRASYPTNPLQSSHFESRCTLCLFHSSLVSMAVKMVSFLPLRKVEIYHISYDVELDAYNRAKRYYYLIAFLLHVSAFLKVNNNINLRKNLSLSSSDLETDGEDQYLPKLETLKSIPAPICDPLSTLRMEHSPYSIPYERVTKLVGGDPPLLTCLQGCYLDAGLCKGNVSRLSWALSRRKGKPPKLVLLTADSNTDPAASVVASSVFSVIDPHEEVLLNTALQTSVQTSFEADSASCPQFYPEKGPRVLDAYLACVDGAATDDGLSVRMRALRRPFLLSQSLWARHDTSVHTSGSGDANDTLGLHDRFVTRRRILNLTGVDSRLFSASSATATAMNDLARRQAVSEWIRFELRSWLDSRLKELGLTNLLKVDGSLQSPWNLDGNVSKSSIFAGIFACLCCGEPSLACRLALTCRMSHLASCLSMAPISDPLCKRALQKQLRVWDELKVLSFMPLQILRTYALLAGEIKLSISSPKGRTVLNVLSGVPYIQALGVHFWYLVDHSTDFLTVLKLFSRNWHAYDSLEVAPPRPPETKDLMIGCTGHDDTEYVPTPAKLSRSSPRDVCYHLLRLASRSWHSLERTLDPQCMQCDQGRRVSGKEVTSNNNWPSSWHLWRVLLSLGLFSLNPIATSRLHVEMASHLETAGLWEWAVFALMHEVEPRVRAASVKRLLARHITLKCPLQTVAEPQWRLDAESVSRFSQAEVFVLERLGVPVKWLHEAKACLARSLLVTQSESANVEAHRLLASLEAAHWLAAGHLEAAHDAYVKYLLPDIFLHSTAISFPSPPTDAKIFSRNSAVLASKLLTALQPFIAIPQESLPTTFDSGAGVYLSYARILHLVGQLTLSNRVEGEGFEEDVNMELSSTAPTSRSSGTLSDLQSKIHQLVGLLQSMDASSIRNRVVKSEMAMTIVRLISVFLHDCPPPQTSVLRPSQTVSGSADFPTEQESLLLCQQLNLISNIESPSETRAGFCSHSSLVPMMIIDIVFSQVFPNLMRSPVLVSLIKALKFFARSVSTAPIPKDEYKLRRSKLAEKIACSCLSGLESTLRHLVIIPAAETQYSSLHVPYPFRQDSYFRYLTGITEPDAVLALEITTKSSEIVRFTPRLFVEERNSHDTRWDGPTIGVDDAALTTGIECTIPLKFFPEYLQMAKSDLSGAGCFFWFSTPFIVRSKAKVPVNRTTYSVISDKFMGSLLIQSNLRNPNPLIDELRLIKSHAELLLMKRAVESTSVALKKTLASAYPGIREAELAARFKFESALMGSGLGYPPVVAGGNRANIIHYLRNSESIEDGQLVLMDVGCDVEGYTADISRAWPVNGHFSQHQRLLHDILIQVQTDCQRAVQPGTNLQNLYDLMVKQLAQYLSEEKVINVSDSELTSVGAYICPHHVGHYLGLDVHDTVSVSYYKNFEPGMVFPLEPGIYFPAGGGKVAVAEEFRGMGLRLEDDYFFTADGRAEKLSDCMPFEALDLESIICSHT